MNIKVARTGIGNTGLKVDECPLSAAGRNALPFRADKS